MIFNQRIINSFIFNPIVIFKFIHVFNTLTPQFFM